MTAFHSASLVVTGGQALTHVAFGGQSEPASAGQGCSIPMPPPHGGHGRIDWVRI
jgi:hypothetical protein